MSLFDQIQMSPLGPAQHLGFASNRSGTAESSQAGWAASVAESSRFALLRVLLTQFAVAALCRQTPLLGPFAGPRTERVAEPGILGCKGRQAQFLPDRLGFEHVVLALQGHRGVLEFSGLFY